MFTRVSHTLIFLLAAALCFFVALLLATGIVTGAHFEAWVVGGFFSFTLAHIA